MDEILTAALHWGTAAVIVLLAAYFGALVFLGQPWEGAAAWQLGMLAGSLAGVAGLAILSALRRI